MVAEPVSIHHTPGTGRNRKLVDLNPDARIPDDRRGKTSLKLDEQTALSGHIKSSMIVSESKRKQMTGISFSLM
jgi:hypothetical protein